MLIQIESFTYTQDVKFNLALNIRRKVFVDELNISKYVEFDGLDAKAIHYLVYIDSLAIGTVRWRQLEDGIKIERLAILEEYRGKGIAIVLIRYVIEELLKSKLEIYLYAMENVTKFFEMQRFKIIGDKVVEANLEHYKMIYTLNDSIIQ